MAKIMVNINLKVFVNFSNHFIDTMTNTVVNINLKVFVSINSDKNHSLLLNVYFNIAVPTNIHKKGK